MIKRKNGKKKGFSLIELIIVLAVMAIIALIAIPNFTAVKKNSANKADEQSCETIKRTVLMLISDETVSVDKETTIIFIPETAVVTGGDISEIEGNDITSALAEVKAPQGDVVKYNSTTKKWDVTKGTSANSYKIVIDNSGNIDVATDAATDAKTTTNK